MTWVAVAIGGAALISGLVQSNSASKAASAQTNAANQANATQWNMYNQNRTDSTPWYNTGVGALGQLNSQFGNGGRPFSMADYQQDPGYAFRFQQGQQALERSGAARGMTLSGAQQKALIGYGQGMGSQEYGNAYARYNNDQTNQFNRLSSMAGLGQQANSMNQQGGMNAANQVSNNQTNLGNALGASSMAQGNAWSGAINSGMNNWNQYNMWNALNGGK
jgi:hypothetical protein